MTSQLNPKLLMSEKNNNNNNNNYTGRDVYLNQEATKPAVRMAAIKPKYTPLLYTLLFLLFIDFLVNSFSELAVFTKIAMIIIYIVQDLCISFNALVLLIMLINTYMFQAGLMGYMIVKFKSVWILTVVYLGFCLGVQIWLMIERFDISEKSFYWKEGQIALYVLQRTTSILYYYIYKRTAYRLSDPRFYEDSDWLRKEFDRRQ